MEFIITRELWISCTVFQNLSSTWAGGKDFHLASSFEHLLFPCWHVFSYCQLGSPYFYIYKEKLNNSTKPINFFFFFFFLGTKVAAFSLHINLQLKIRKRSMQTICTLQVLAYLLFVTLGKTEEVMQSMWSAFTNNFYGKQQSDSNTGPRWPHYWNLF